MAACEMREKILDAAARLFATKGYAAVSMRRVATEVGMTPANLYYHFKDKEDLVRSSLAYVFERETPTFERIVQQESGDPLRCLERLTNWFASLLFEDTIFARLLVRELLEDDADRLEFLTKNVFQSSFSTLVRIIEESLETDDPVLAALFLSSTVIGYVQYSVILPFLHGARPEYSDPQKITQYLMREIRNKAKKGLVVREK